MRLPGLADPEAWPETTSSVVEAALNQVGDTRYLRIGSGALSEVGTLVSHCFGERQAIVVVADDNTFAAAGRSVDELLRAAGRIVAEPIVLPGNPPLYADQRQLLGLGRALSPLDVVPVVVGSGTLNDLTKLAAHRLGRPYLCIATAASMDGYASFGAIITEEGFKRTIGCPAPRAVLADLDVLARAPVELNAAGFGDLLGKVTAGADWILADALEIEPIIGPAWSLVQDHLRGWIARPDRLRLSDPQAIEVLFQGLSAAGIAMQLSSSSRPASGSEHRFSHLWEMQALSKGEAPVLHGFKVGVGSIAAAALYELLLARDLTRLDIAAACRSWPSRVEVERSVRQAHEDPRISEHAVAESLAKHIDADSLERRLYLLRKRWPEVRERLQAQLLTARELRELLRQAGCPTHPSEIGVGPQQFRESHHLARTIRSRYTVLDLAAEIGLLNEFIGELFDAGGFWHSGNR